MTTQSTPLAKRLGRLVKQKHLFFAGQALTLIGLLAFLLAGAIIAADVLFGLQEWLRWTAFLLLLTLSIGGIVRRLLLPSLHYHGPEAVREVEHRFEDLGQMLRTSAEISDSEAAREAGFSPDLVQALQSQAEERVSETDLKALIPWDVVRKRAVELACVVLVFVAALCLWKDFRRGAQRLLLPAAELPFTHVEAAASAETFERGDTIVVNAQASGRTTDYADLHIREEEGEWDMIRMDSLPEGRFTYPLGGRAASFEFYVSSGDGRSRIMPVRFIDPPVVLTVTTGLEYPAYTGLAAEEVEDEEITAVEGTRARVTFQLNHGLVTGNARWQDQDVAVELTENTVLCEVEVVVGKHVLELTGKDDEDLPLAPYRFTITGLPDRLPKVEILEPKEDPTVTKLTEVPVLVRARDDFGLAEIGLVLSVNGREEALKTRPFGADESVFGSRLSHTILLEKHALDFRSNVRLYAFARDYKPRAGARAVSDLVAIDIRPFKILYRMKPSGEPEMSEAEMEEQADNIEELEKAIAAQRRALSQTFRMREQQTTDPQSAEALARTEEALAEKITEIAETAAPLTEPQNQSLLPEAAEAMRKAADKLREANPEEAFAAEDIALANMLKMRQELIHELSEQKKNAPPKPSAKKQQPPKQQQSLDSLAAEAERLAKEELAIAQQLESPPTQPQPSPQPESPQEEQAPQSQQAQPAAESESAPESQPAPAESAASQTPEQGQQSPAAQSAQGQAQQQAEQGRQQREQSEAEEAQAQQEPAAETEQSSAPDEQSPQPMAAQQQATDEEPQEAQTADAQAAEASQSLTENGNDAEAQAATKPASEQQSQEAEQEPEEAEQADEQNAATTGAQPEARPPEQAAESATSPEAGEQQPRQASSEPSAPAEQQDTDSQPQASQDQQQASISPESGSPPESAQQAASQSQSPQDTETTASPVSPADQAIAEATERQSKAVADANALGDQLDYHPEKTDLAMERMKAVARAMNEASEALKQTDPEAAQPALTDAAERLEQLAEHLRGLDQKNLADMLARAQEKAEQAAQQLENPPEASPQSNEDQQQPENSSSPSPQASQQAQAQESQPSQSQSEAQESPPSQSESQAQAQESQPSQSEAQAQESQPSQSQAQAQNESHESHETQASQSQAQARESQPSPSQDQSPAEQAAAQRESTAQDAETVADWLRETSKRDMEGLEAMQERLAEARKELAVDKLGDDVRQAQQQREQGQEADAARTESDAAQRFRELAETLSKEKQRLVQAHLERLAEAEAEAQELKRETETQQEAAEAAAQAQSESQSESQAQAQAQSESQSQAEAQAQSESQAPSQSESQARSQSQAEAQAQAQAQAEAKGESGKASPLKPETAERLEELAEELKDLKDEELDELGDQLLEQVGAQNVRGSHRTARVAPKEIAETTLEPTVERLRTLINEIVQKEFLLNRDDRVPDKYTRLVERYFKALSDDLSE